MISFLNSSIAKVGHRYGHFLFCASNHCVSKVADLIGGGEIAFCVALTLEYHPKADERIDRQCSKSINPTIGRGASNFNSQKPDSSESSLETFSNPLGLNGQRALRN
jgi:hypothetical protein